MTALHEHFLHRSGTFLTGDFLPRIRVCLEQLPDEDIWWRPNEETNSVGNLIVHLAGNVRQWIISGVGGAPDHRDRQSEFDRREGLGRVELLDLLGITVEEAARVIEGVTAAQLLEKRSIQGREVTVMTAIYHVVEHFSMHTGQIMYITKLRTGRDLGLYRVVDGIPRETWGRPD